MYNQESFDEATRDLSAIRDPVHKWIKFSEQERKIIDSPLFQRLRWVSQLTSANEVFPGGMHSRLLHSIGVMYLSGKYIKNIVKNSIKYLGNNHELIINKDKYIQLARLAGLLHDIGHGPFSHAFDRAIYQYIYDIPDGGHDKHRITIINSDQLSHLINSCGITADELEKVWKSKLNNNSESDLTEINKIYLMIGAIVHGPLGSDRMDFVLRDSYFTGTQHLGTIASDRIIANALYRDGKLHYRMKCLSDIIQALDGRFHMYECVYLHKASYAASILIEDMMKLSKIHLRLVERTMNLDEFIWLNDYTLIGEIMSYTGNNNDMLKAQENCKKLLARSLPKMIDEKTLPANEYKTLDLNIPDKLGQKTVRTRNICRIEPKKFREYSIMILSKSGKSLTCEEALKFINYKPSQESVYIIRTYLMD